MSNLNNDNLDNNQAVQALLELRRAQKNSFGNYYKAIESEIQKIKQSAQINYQSLSDDSYLQRAVWFFPPVVSQSVFLIFWLATLFCFYKIFKFRKLTYKYLMIFILTGLVGAFLIFSFKQRKLNLAIVKHDTQLRLGPDINHISRRKLKKLEEVEMASKVGDWYKVEADSIIGWVQNTDLELVNNNEF